MITSLMMGVFMFRRLTKFCTVFAILCGVGSFLLGITSLTGCGTEGVSNTKEEALDYTVVESEDVPVELLKLIDERKSSTLRLTFTTRDYTYIVAGYGTKETSGYSIKVNDVYLGNGAICADFTLIGPAASESVTEVRTMPYIVIKIEKRDEAIIFKL